MRRRLVLAIAVVAAVAVVLLAVPLAVVLQRSYRDEERLRLQRDTIAAVRGIDLGAGGADRIELPRTGDVLGAYDRAGRRVAGRGPARAPAVVRSVLRGGRPADARGDGLLVVAVPLLTSERVTGAVRAQRSDAAITRDTRRAWLALGALAVGIIAAAAIAAALLGRRLAAPLERLAAAARRLGDGDFAVRAPRASIPEVDAVAGALDATAQRLDELVSRERAFSADASHQLRTPLQALRIELESIQLRGGAPPELPAALAQVDRLQATIDTLLAVARDAPRRAATTDLAALLDGAEERWRGPLAAQGRPLRTRVEEPAAAPAAAPVGAVTAPRAVAAAGERVVEEILDVLLANAHRHGAGPVSVRVHRADGWLAIDVADGGHGFGSDPEQAFARRARGDGAGGGHGIGLALARSLAQAEGGRLEVARPGPEPVVRLLLRSVP